MKIEQRDPIEFKPGKFHPALKQIPELSQDCDEFLALAAGQPEILCDRAIDAVGHCPCGIDVTELADCRLQHERAAKGS